MTQSYLFHVRGMHCNACMLLIESVLGEVQGVTHVKSDLRTHSVKVEGDLGDKIPDDIARDLSRILGPHGYTLTIEKQDHDRRMSDFFLAIPIAAIFVVSFILLQKLGIVNLVNTSSISFGAAFFIGVIASLSTCMAVVGGLVLSLSATFAKEGDSFRPQVLFHLGRIGSFFILGGVIGAIGAAFTLNATAMFILGLLVGLVMLILGINLLDLFPKAKQFQLSMPSRFGKHAVGISQFTHVLTPFFVGIATFFLPCGFTQAMQVYSLTTGSFLSGALTMLAFALGTLPVLAIIGLSSFSIKNSKYAGVFFKSAGLIVILFALFNIVNSLVVIGVLQPIFNF